MLGNAEFFVNNEYVSFYFICAHRYSWVNLWPDCVGVGPVIFGHYLAVKPYRSYKIKKNSFQYSVTNKPGVRFTHMYNKEILSWRIRTNSLSQNTTALQPNVFLTGIHRNKWGTRWRIWLRHCATSRKVAGSIPDGVTGFFYWHNPSGRTMALGSTQSLTEMSTRNISWG